MSLTPGDAAPSHPPPRPPVPQVSIRVESDSEESSLCSNQRISLYPPKNPPPPETHRDFYRNLHAHFGDSCAETIL